MLETGRGPLEPLAAGEAEADAAERLRSRIQSASNDAVMDASLHGKTACGEDRGAASALLASDLLEAYGNAVLSLKKEADSLSKAGKAGDGAFFTADEASRAERVLAASKAAERDVEELRGQFAAAVLPLMKRHGCALDGMEPASDGTIEARDRERVVELPAPHSRRSPAGISPEIPAVPARVIRFRVNNGEGRNRYVVTLDGKEIGELPPGSSRIFAARIGSHDLCILPDGPACGDPGTVRRVYLHEGWTMEIKPALK
jgi:hypothetical protein